MLTLPAPTTAFDGMQFETELAAAGLPSISYISGDRLVLPALADADRTAVGRVLAAHQPAGLAARVETDAARARLRDLHSKGWANLTAAEKTEIQKHALALLGQ